MPTDCALALHDDRTTLLVGTSRADAVQTGAPLTVTDGFDNSLTGIGGDRPNIIGNPNLDNSRSRGERISKWFNTAAFKTNAAGTVGQLGVNTMRGPGSWNLDFGLFKNFRFRERYAVQYRAEFFNLFNHANLGMPNASVISPSFGRITSTSGPRVIEMALKFVF